MTWNEMKAKLKEFRKTKVGKICQLLFIGVIAATVIIWPISMISPRSNRKIPELEEITNPTPTPESTAEVRNDVNYIFVGGLFMGSYENGTWNSNQSSEAHGVKQLRQFTTAEVKAHELELYDRTIRLGKTRKYIDPAQEEADRLALEPSPSPTPEPTPTEIPDLEPEPTEEPSPTPEPPKVITPILLKLSYKKDGTTETPLGLSMIGSPFSERANLNKPATDATTTMVREFLSNKGIGASTVNIWRTISADVDNDGIIEEIIFAGTPYDENGRPRVTAEDRLSKDPRGIYYAVLLVKNNFVTPIYFRSRPIKMLEFANESTTEYAPGEAFRVEFIGLFDINFNKRLEICLREHNYSTTSTYVYATNQDGKYSIALFADWPNE